MNGIEGLHIKKTKKADVRGAVELVEKRGKGPILRAVPCLFLAGGRSRVTTLKPSQAL